MPLVLHKTDGSPPVRAVLMTIDILKLKVEFVEVNTLAGETRRPEYVAKNPMHTVPLLEDGNFTLADSHAIITYLVSKYGGEKRAELYPNDFSTRATIDQRLYFDAAVLFPRLISILRPVFRDKATGPTAQQIEDVKEGYGMLERYLQKSEYLVGSTITLADISLAATVSTLNVIVPLTEEFPKTIQWLNNLRGTDFYKKANEPGLTKITEFYNLSIKNNSS
ncbi:glutathione S-transferase 1-like [Galleria mellonella]|uniref:Glutathione S-transferase 1-like n=1 Tax=Galleria mellonella TaxID=7137 RepID=A0A6J1X7Z8_GALME|nr:glutathione S-transferase 1-like [Galleria mellonella]